MQFIKDIMPYTPDTWTKEFVYNNKRYILVDLDEDSAEFKDVETHFRQQHYQTFPELTIQRVQHPFAFARYKLHEEALTRNYVDVVKEIKYVSIKEEHIPIYLEYNGDARRVSSVFRIRECYVRVQRITSGYFGERDSNTYPEYTIKLKQSTS